MSLERALTFAKAGYPVFPCKPTKAPYTPRGFQDATQDPETIRLWWQRWPEAGVGIPTGEPSSLFVLDCDIDKTTGEAVGERSLEMLGLPQSCAPCVATPSGGKHFYFRYAPGLKSTVRTLGDYLDTRGAGGYVISYFSDPPDPASLPELPSAILDRLTGKQPQATELVATTDARAITAKLNGDWRGTYGSAPCPICQPEGRRDQRALTLKDGRDGRLLAYCHKMGCDFVAILGALGIPATAHRPIDLLEFATLQKHAHAVAAPDPAICGDDPVDLWGRLDPPALPRGVLPQVIEDFAFGMAERMGADPAGLAVAALVTCAAAIPDRIRVKVKVHDDWTESARIWAALVGSPSTKKSPILSAATAPLCRADAQSFREWQQARAEFDALPKDEKHGRVPPPQTRHRIEDATVEAAQAVLEGSPWGVLLLQDELSGFFGQMDKYSGGKGASADRAFWLRAFNGGEFALNRVGRGAALIPNLSVCLLGGIQPEPIRKIAADAADDGLLQRLFPIVLRPATVGQDAPLPDVADRYADLIERLLAMTPPGFPGVCEFSADAQAIRRQLEQRHLDLQAAETVSRKLAAHIGKYDGLFARLALTLQCIESTGLSPNPIIGADIADKTKKLLHSFFLPHAAAFYAGILGLSDDHDRLQAVAAHILVHKLERITNRDVQRGDRAMRAIKEADIRGILEQLEALGWLYRIPAPRPSSPPHWGVNPAVHRRFADRAATEAKRRDQAKAAVAAMLTKRAEDAA